MKKEWAELAARLRARHCEEMLSRAVDESLVRRTEREVADDILTSMRERFGRKDWGAVCRLVWLAQCYPDRKFTPLLCELLDHPQDDGYMEAVADALFDIADERSVPTMIRSLDYYVPGDDDRHFSRKLLHALARVGTEEAIEGLRLALQNEDEIIRRHARQELDLMDKRGL